VGPTNNTVGGERGASSISAQVNRPLENKNIKNGTSFQTGNRGGLCFICYSPGHKQANCPTRKTSDSRGVDLRVAARPPKIDVQEH